MRVSEQGLNLIRQCEGFHSKPYRCPGGYLSIGYGHLMHPAETFKMLTRGEGEILLQRDVEKAVRSLRRLITVPLLQHQIDALVSFVYNLGAGAFQRSRLRQCINRGDHGLVPAELMRWVRVNGKILPGLVRRRYFEARLYQGHSCSL